MQRQPLAAPDCPPPSPPLLPGVVLAAVAPPSCLLPCWDGSQPLDMHRPRTGRPVCPPWAADLGPSFLRAFPPWDSGLLGALVRCFTQQTQEEVSHLERSDLKSNVIQTRHWHKLGQQRPQYSAKRACLEPKRGIFRMKNGGAIWPSRRSLYSLCYSPGKDSKRSDQTKSKHFLYAGC